jgi:hypothetical protein
MRPQLPVSVFVECVFIDVYLALTDLSTPFDCSYNGQKHLKVVQKNNQYGFSSPCTYPSLMDLVLFYSENSLVQHNPSLTTTLEHPINA